MTEVKRDASGKFAKKKKKPENPDCQPATKGYVKCVVRKAAEHKHKFGFDCGSIVIMVVLLSLAWVFCVSIHESNLAWITGIGALMMVSVGACYDEDKKTETSTIDGRICTDYVYPDYLKKYTPPVCEKKKECGDN